MTHVNTQHSAVAAKTRKHTNTQTHKHNRTRKCGGQQTLTDDLNSDTQEASKQTVKQASKQSSKQANNKKASAHGCVLGEEEREDLVMVLDSRLLLKVS